MATDADGRTIALGDNMLVAATVRRIEGDNVVVVRPDGQPMRLVGSQLIHVPTIAAEIDGKVDAAAGAFTTQPPTSAVAATTATQLVRQGEVQALFDALNAYAISLAALITTNQTNIASNDTDIADLQTGKETKHDQRFFHHVADFINSGTTQNGYSSNTSGTGAGFGQNWDKLGSVEAFGLLEIRTGTTSTGRATLLTWNNVYDPSSANYSTDFEAWLFVSDLATVSEDYELRVGWTNDGGSAGDSTRAAYWRYDRSADGDFWVAVVRDGGSESKVVTAVAPSTTALQHLAIDWSEDGGTINFTLDGSKLATFTTASHNVPTSRLGLAVKMEKTAGTTQRICYLDRTEIIAERTSDR